MPANREEIEEVLSDGPKDIQTLYQEMEEYTLGEIHWTLQQMVGSGNIEYDREQEKYSLA